MTSLKKTGAVLPWQPPTDASGYTKLDLELVVDDTFGKLTVRRQKPKEESPGNFAVYHNDERVSGLTHSQRPDALAEAERWFYAQPQFAKSNNAVALNVMLENGKVAYQTGKSIYANPNTRGTVDHSQWAAGWLLAQNKGIMDIALTRFKNSMEATGRAVEQTNHDLNLVSSRLQAWMTVLEYADKLSSDPYEPPIDVSHANFAWARAYEFIADFKSGNVELMSKKWGGWSQFLFDKKLGPPPDTPIDTAE